MKRPSRRTVGKIMILAGCLMLASPLTIVLGLILLWCGAEFIGDRPLS
jgi:hypothetical protein